MSKLNIDKQISPWQWAVMNCIFGIGSATITSTFTLAALAQQAAWLAALVAGGVYFCVAWLMIRLAASFPGQTLSSFLKILWGKAVGIVIVWFLVLALTAEIIVRLQLFSREITFFMFDRTPPEVIILTMLAVSAYCAVQDLGTVLQISQILFFTALPMMMMIILLGYISFHVINIYPLWPVNIAGVGRAIAESWVYFFGYEFILYLLPFIYRGNTSIVKATGIAFALKSLLMAVTILMVIGVHTVEGLQGSPYPTMIAIRGVELPGTFVERLDNYLFFLWIPIGFMTFAQYLFFAAAMLADLHGYKDHRPIVLFFVPVLFIGSAALHDATVFTEFSKWIPWPGLLFSFGIIPASYLLARWKLHRQGVTLDGR
ncbi:GerAB/ArcD/ProY family transporter [Sporomusa aerivorans]|uniref:GerAB/ArcD/ProY family transporter n=1 Tax=Sporomusa aerivorans TaxID=204936 RepID=UPI00352BA707